MNTFAMFLYTRDPKFARQAGKNDKYPCYRTIICHVLFSYYGKNNNSIKTAKQVFEKLFQSYSNGEPFVEGDFLALYPVNMGDNMSGYLLVDKSDGIYPLVIYPYSKSSGPSGKPNSPRASALNQVMDDLNSNIDNIISEFKGCSEWDISLEEKLRKNHFHEKSESQESEF